MSKHGGLAKAGKVRKQTPKVARQEVIMKPKCGRANMRRKFTKRFYFMKQNQMKKFNKQKDE